MMLEFDTINTLIALAAVTNLIYGFLVYKRNKNSANNIAFFLLTVAVTVWGVAMIIFRSTESNAVTLAASYWLYAAAAAIPTFFVLFASLFPKDSYSLTRKQTFLIFAPLAAITLIIFTPSLFIESVLQQHGKENIIVFNTSLQIIYALYVAGMFLASYAILIKKYRASTGVLRSQVIYILIGAMVPTLVGLFSNLLLPLYNEFRWNWMGQISIAVTTGVITYGIFKHRIFDIRVIATEILIFVVWFIAFMRIVFASSTTAVLFNIFTFLILLAVGLGLIRSVTREVETREKLEKLTKELKVVNTRLRELDRQKSEFLSIATHQLRGPLAGIRGHLSLIVDGSYGKIPERAKDIIEKVFSSSGLLAQTINDFLDVSRIEQGSMQYEMKEFECNELVADVQQELTAVAKDRKLELSFADECEGKCTVNADYGKLRHIFFNLVDNAIKYTEKGWVKIRMFVDTKRGVIRTEISDSGIGIDPEEIGALFEKFVRARDASGININGTGLGLYVAREMVEAHKGKVWAESEGKGKGSTFIVEIPTVKKSASKKA